VQEIDSQSTKWDDFKQLLQTTYDEATRRYREYEPIIKYIEEAMMDPEATFAKQVKLDKYQVRLGREDIQ
jgi:hypothetical protein